MRRQLRGHDHHSTGRHQGASLPLSFLSLCFPFEQLSQVRMQALALSPPPPSLLAVSSATASARWRLAASSDVAVRMLNSSGIRESLALTNCLW